MPVSPIGDFDYYITNKGYVAYKSESLHREWVGFDEHEIQWYLLPINDIIEPEKFLEYINCCTITEDASDTPENYYYKHEDIIEALQSTHVLIINA